MLLPYYPHSSRPSFWRALYIQVSISKQSKSRSTRSSSAMELPQEAKLGVLNLLTNFFQTGVKRRPTELLYILICSILTKIRLTFIQMVRGNSTDSLLPTQSNRVTEPGPRHSMSMLKLKTQCCRTFTNYILASFFLFLAMFSSV